MPQEGVDQMKALHRKLALGLVIGIGSVAMFGAAALGAFGLGVSSSVGSAIAPVGSVLGAEKPDKFKGILDALVQKGVITQQQEDAILAAMKDAASKDSVRVHVMHDLFGAAAQYLGTTEKDLRAKLPGTSLGKIADGMGPAKSRAGLVAALTTAANADIDKAAADKKITTDQATTLKSKVGAEIATFVDRKFPVRNSTKPASPAIGTKPAPPTTTNPTTPASPSPTPREDR